MYVFRFKQLNKIKYFITNMLNKDCDINGDLAMNKKAFIFL